MPKFTEPTTLEPETEAQAPVSSLPPELLQFMTDMSRQVTVLTEKMAAVESGRANMRPQNHLDRPGAVDRLRVPKDGTPFMDPKLARQTPTMNGAPLSPNGMMAYTARFRVGSRVTLNLDTSRGQVKTEIVMQTFERKDHQGNPFSDTKEIKKFIPITWREVVAQEVAKHGQLLCPSAPGDGFACQGVMDPGDSCPVCGWAPTIARVEFVDDRGQWIYKINMPGISSGARQQAFADYELDPA